MPINSFDTLPEKGFAYIVCHPVRRGNEIQKAMLNFDGDGDFKTSNITYSQPVGEL